MKLDSVQKKHLFTIIKTVVVPLIIANIILVVLVKPVGMYSKEFAGYIYQVQPETAYSDHEAYLAALERQKALTYLPIWMVMLLVWGVTFVFIIRPKLKKIKIQSEEHEALSKAKKSDQWKLMFDDVKKIFNEWDPIGVVEEGVLDEYDTYALQIAGKLINGKSADDIEEYLKYTVNEVIGMNVPDSEFKKLAKRFFALVEK